ncbi:hypothetical protein AVEN_143538-1 [Araneus ventricosus]|uniref:Uncharacterized protein n=1 Tax=Araneus ventricosus TaxID=182803 RepID=A0A4Y2ANW1_ARAVE|nr:hypothetical protein AVEN_143538-1 [Araneus ventricosus]
MCWHNEHHSLSRVLHHTSRIKVVDPTQSIKLRYRNKELCTCRTTHLLEVQRRQWKPGMALEFARRGPDLPDWGARPAVRGGVGSVMKLVSNFRQLLFINYS